MLAGIRDFLKFRRGGSRGGEHEVVHEYLSAIEQALFAVGLQTDSEAAAAGIEIPGRADITADVLPHVGHALAPALVERALQQLRTFIPARLWREAVMTAAEMDQADARALQPEHPPGPVH